MALVLFGCLFNISIAFPVGRISNSTLRLRASCFTSFITGRAPIPVPMTNCSQFHGIFSSVDSGVCPKDSRYFLDGFFFRFLIFP